MPFKSNAQRRYLWSQKPELAHEFASETPKGLKLPDHVKGSKSSKGKKMRSKAKHMGPKVAAALQAQQLIPGAPPVLRLPAPAGQPPAPPAAPAAPQAQAPATQPPAPQQPGKGAQQVLTAQNIQKNHQAAPGAVVPSEAAVAAKLDKMAASLYQGVVGNAVKARLDA